MGRNDMPERRGSKGGFTLPPLPELLGVVAILAVLAAIFFPVFQGVHSPPNGAILDGAGKPIPGAVLRFRDPAGRLIATATADANGRFRQHGLGALSQDAVDGFGLSFSTHRSGSSDLYVFTPLGLHVATFRDNAGHPVPGLAVALIPHRRTRQRALDGPQELVSDKNGNIQVNQTPTGVRFEFQSEDPNYVIERTQATADGNTVRYAVAVATPGTITGCLRDEDGRPLRGYKAFATVSPDLNHFDRWYSASLITGPTGRFRITNLKPRVYYVSAAPARGFHAVAPAQRVTLAQGQTAEVSLRVDTMEGPPNDD